jgi:mannose-6-phosphate isomerase-like protein (cupin superfamily)
MTTRGYLLTSSGITIAEEDHVPTEVIQDAKGRQYATVFPHNELECGFSFANLETITLEGPGQIERHRTISQILYIVSGHAEVYSPDGGIRVLAAGDSVGVPAGVFHALRPTGTRPVKMMCVNVPAWREGDTEFYEDRPVEWYGAHA